MRHALDDEASYSSVVPLFSGGAGAAVLDPAGWSSSSRIYYRAVGEVPFQWESRPGRPKDLPAASYPTPPPPLSPPPAMQSAQLARRRRRQPPEPQTGSLWLWLWTALARGGRGGTRDQGPKASKPFARASKYNCCSSLSSAAAAAAAAASSSSLLPGWDGFFMPLETNVARRSTPADKAAGGGCRRWRFSRLLVCLNRGF